MHTNRRVLAAVALLLTTLLAACGSGGGPSFALTGLGLIGDPLGGVAGGVVDGGDTVVIAGYGFEDGAAVLFGDTPAVTVTFISVNEIRAVTPAMPAGAVDVVIRNPDDTEARRPNAFVFGLPPTLLEVVALDGPAAGQAVAAVDTPTEFEVRGTDFKDGASVMVDGADVAETFVDANTIRFTAPARGTEVRLDVTVRNPEGIAETLSSAIFYTAEFSLAPQPGTLDEQQVRHLLRRGAFGASAPVVASRVGTTANATCAWLVNVTRDSAVQQVEADAFAIYGDTAPPANDVNARANQEWWIHLIRNNPQPLQERLTWFLHEHFATNQDQFGGSEKWWMHDQMQLFRRFCLPRSQGGLDYDWQDLLVEVSKNRAMLEWLDGTNSRRGNPNENFARELWELFMLGEGNGYVQADIVEAAKAFTGFDDVDEEGTDYKTVRYFVDRHDERDKTIFGMTGKFGYDSISPFHENGAGIATDPRDTDGGVVALTLRERPVEASTFICRKLAAFFLYDDPSDAVVAALAQTLRDNDWNMKPVLREILNSKAMFSAHARKAKIKDPAEYVFQFLRTTGIDFEPSRIRSALDVLLQRPLHPPDVDGWPTGEAWMGGQNMLERINFIRDVIERLDDVPTQIDPLVPPAGQRSPTELVDHIADTMGVELTEVARTEFITYVTTTLEDGAEVPFAYDPTNAGHLEMKTRGLLYLIAQYHNGHRQ
ncbi:MAG: DUF1800 family protein [Planctomycetota bacterium]|nr:DUF1800 family protein [Planctomycetota bacterium]